MDATKDDSLLAFPTVTVFKSRKTTYFSGCCTALHISLSSYVLKWCSLGECDSV